MPLYITPAVPIAALSAVFTSSSEVERDNSGVTRRQTARGERRTSLSVDSQAESDGLSCHGEPGRAPGAEAAEGVPHSAQARSEGVPPRS